MEKQSAEVHRDYRQAIEKFDYFLTGVTIAICGYLIQTYDASGLKNFELVSYLGMFSICVFLISILFSLLRLEKLIHGKRNNYDYLRINEQITDIGSEASSGKAVYFNNKPASNATILAEIEKRSKHSDNLVIDMNELAESAEWLYLARNYTFLLGIALQFITRILYGIL